MTSSNAANNFAQSKTKDDGSPAPIFDLAFLDHQTLGRDDLRTDILKLFKTQLEQHAAALDELDDLEAIKVRVHTIKGASHGVGAQRLAFAAAAAEKPYLRGEAASAELMQVLRDCLEETLAAITQMTS